MNRRTLVSFVSALPLIGLLTPKKAQARAVTGLAARRQEAIDLFTKGLDECIKAEGLSYKDQLNTLGLTLQGPVGFNVRILVDYEETGKRVQIGSSPSVKWTPQS